MYRNFYNLYNNAEDGYYKLKQTCRDAIPEKEKKKIRYTLRKCKEAREQKQMLWFQKDR